MRVVWTPEAVQDRNDILDFVAAADTLAAFHMDELFANAAARLADFPMMGRAGIVPGTRELFPHENY